MSIQRHGDEFPSDPEVCPVCNFPLDIHEEGGHPSEIVVESNDGYVVVADVA